MESGQQVTTFTKAMTSVQSGPRLGLPTDIMGSNSSSQSLMDRVNKAGIEVSSIIDNVGQLVREQTENTRVKRETDEMQNRMNWANYQR